MSQEASQEVEVTVEGVITRLVPCPDHAASATGQMVWDGERALRNPNGYHHDCDACKATPTTTEALERTVTRHVW